MRDIGVALRSALIANPSIQYEVGNKVYINEMPDAQVNNMPEKCIVIYEQGGTEMNHYAPLAIPRFDVWCYGASYFEAGEVDGAFWDYAHNVSMQDQDDTLIQSIILSGGPRAGKEPDTGWPVKIRSITVRYSTEEN